MPARCPWYWSTRRSGCQNRQLHNRSEQLPHIPGKSPSGGHDLDFDLAKRIGSEGLVVIGVDALDLKRCARQVTTVCGRNLVNF